MIYGALEDAIDLGKRIWLNVSMASVSGSVLAALIFMPTYPEAQRFLWAMAVFGISLLASIPLLAMFSIPALWLVRMLANRSNNVPMLSLIYGGVTGVLVASMMILLLSVLLGKNWAVAHVAGVQKPMVFNLKLLIVAYAYFSLLALFTALNLPHEREEI
jgi:hypothetical protein